MFKFFNVNQYELDTDLQITELCIKNRTNSWHGCP